MFVDYSGILEMCQAIDDRIYSEQKYQCQKLRCREMFGTDRKVGRKPG